MDSVTPRGVFTFETNRRDAGALEVVSFTGREEVSKLFTFDVLVNEPIEQADSFEQDALGGAARLLVRGVDEARCVRGIVRAVAVSNSHRRTDRIYYRVRVAPRLWLLTRTRNSRIFQEKTVQEIVTAVLDAHRVRHRWSLRRKLSTRVYCVQHQESDLHFVRRLLAEEGVFFYFQWPSPTASLRVEEELVLADHVDAYNVIAGDPVLPFRDPDRMDAHEEFVAAFSVRGRVRTGATKLQEFEFRHPSQLLVADAQVRESPGALETEAALRRYEHHMEFDRDDIDNPAARLLLERARTSRTVGEGRSWSPRLSAGYWFALDGTGLDAQNQCYTVSRVTHRGQNPAAEGARHEQSGERVIVYENEFACVRKTVALRPRPVARRIQQVMETATVVGPAGEEIHTDEYGRIKVQFHWDLEGQRDEHSSCWIRTMQSWAGQSWGFQFIPRVGMEVLVLFTGGDTDRPIVVGGVYNGENAPPFPLPQMKTRSGIRTHSSLHNDGFNELSFEDLTGQEQVYVHAQRDMDEEILNNHTVQVGHSQSIRVGVDQNESVGASQQINVGAMRTVRVGAAEDHTVVGDRHVRVGGRQSTRVGGNLRADVDGDHVTSVNGTVRTRVVQNHTTEVGGNLAQVVDRDHRLEVRGWSLCSVARDALMSVRGNHQVVVTGQHSLAVSGAATMSGDGDVSTTTTKKLTLQADEGITFTCGSSTVKILKDEIQVTAKKLTFKGIDEASLRGGGKAVLKLHGDAELTASTVTAKSSGASLALDGEAALKGAKVKLGTGAGGATSDRVSEQTQENEAREWVFQLFEPAATAGEAPVPLRNVPVTATGHGPEPFSGSTDGDGNVRVPVVYAECVIHVVAGRYTFDLHAGGLQSQQDDQQRARAQLYNLGHGPADVDGWERNDLRAAVGRFQASNSITESGLLLDDTLSAIRGRHGG